MPAASPSRPPLRNPVYVHEKHRIDDEIFEDAITTFPELSENEHAKVTKLDEEWMKSESGKTRWRDFIQR